jgi:hypothetical protein
MVAVALHFALYLYLTTLEKRSVKALVSQALQTVQPDRGGVFEFLVKEPGREGASPPHAALAYGMYLSAGDSIEIET